ncbi:fumarylacetoacetate hydrolase family protein [Allonocardiopsis opalescens]|uniref:Acylpyruvate hydrolase n=1 Tax=Allonocardiopsis opalescens TaxID=1144618 RepID=A0A2T0Q0U8_9ACTN|nr:fumarylacetoacetate hydrolase family protein [Allonocardiopsis opalescens]PRX97303.1 acylpyruvate hydrolase [Allonocardiopsis opalescens]
MRLATIRTPDGTSAARVSADGSTLVELPAADVGAVLARPDWPAWAAAQGGREHDAATADHAPLVPRPEKIICVGLNYRAHILEMGRELPDFPTLFAKYAPALIGAEDDIELPAVSEAVDWEAELAVVVGRPVERADPAAAAAAIGGYTVLNDVTARDWQYRTKQWLQGKTFARTTPLGPYLVTPDDPAVDPAGHTITSEVNGVEKQRSTTGDLLFDPVRLVSYISAILPLSPGDVIATGTPGGVGHARSPREYLADGDTLVTRIEGIGECRNPCRAAK